MIKNRLDTKKKMEVGPNGIMGLMWHISNASLPKTKRGKSSNTLNMNTLFMSAYGLIPLEHNLRAQPM